MRNHDQQTRQMWKCAYEPAPGAAFADFVRVREPDGFGDVLTECPGYTTALPETIEAVRAWVHWEKGELRSLVARPSERLISAIEIVNSSVARHRELKLKPRSKGGLGDD